MTELTECLNIPEITFMSIFASETRKLDRCIQTSSLRKKRSSFLSWVFADGAELDDVESSLSDAIRTYNENFEKINSYEDMVKI